jgi:hypothetical protein
LIAHEGQIENTRYRNVYRLTTPRVLTAYPDVRASYERVAFLKEEARRFRPDEVEFIAFGHPLLDAIVTECRKRDEGFGGAAAVRPLPQQVQAQAGILFNFVLRYTDASGEVLSEDFMAVFVNGHGQVVDGAGEALLAHPTLTEAEVDPDSEPVSSLRRALDGLHTIAFGHTQSLSQQHRQMVSARRERSVQIQLQDLERWYQAHSEVHRQRLQEYRHRLSLGEDMNIAIRGEEYELNELQATYDSRKLELESQRTVVSQAPELLNVALFVNRADGIR